MNDLWRRGTAPFGPCGFFGQFPRDPIGVSCSRGGMTTWGKDMNNNFSFYFDIYDGSMRCVRSIMMYLNQFNWYKNKAIFIKSGYSFQMSFENRLGIFKINVFPYFVDHAKISIVDLATCSYHLTMSGSGAI